MSVVAAVTAAGLVGLGGSPAIAAAKRTIPVSVNSRGVPVGGGWPALSGDGRYVAFGSTAKNLDPRCRLDTGAVFVRDLVAGTTECVSLDNSGVPLPAFISTPYISDDGRYIEYDADPVDPQNSAASGVFVRDRIRDITIRANVKTSGAVISGGCYPAAMSRDGSTVAFYTAGGTPSFYIRDLVHNSTKQVSRAYYTSCADSPLALSGNGRYVAFRGLSDLGQGGLLLLDRRTGKRSFVRSASSHPSLSADGSVLAYDTGVAIDSGDTNGASDVYVLDRTTRRTTLVSVSSTGALGNGVSFRPAVSPNGQFVAFLSVASNLVPADTNDCDDVFVHSRLTGVTFRTNRTSTGGQATSGITTLGGEPIGITTDAADETLVAFTSSAALVPEDRDGTDDDVYLRGP